ncbi:MAG: polysaccharide deacetylase family protein [Solirubrobacterales bacterium]|nr:polysaccharide deacetylase family protein [Solirubrobacterales bacterium]
MLRRRRQDRVRSARAGSSLLSGGQARRRRPWGIRAALLLLPLVPLGCAAALVASATSASSSPPVRPQQAAIVPAPLTAHGTAPDPANLDVKAIDRVLAYTPFVRAGLPRRKLIALTFDDGPSPYTEGLVAELVRLHVPATFFVVGQQLDYFSAGLRDEIRHGFVIGDHTENHPPLTLMTPAAQYEQIHTDAERIHHFGGGWPQLFRPPYGLFNNRTLAILSRLRMLMVMWSVDPRDWLRPPAETIVARVLQTARPGAIVELHDGGGDRSQTLAAIPGIVAGLRRRHYQLVTVPELLAADPPPRHQKLTHLVE